MGRIVVVCRKNDIAKGEKDVRFQEDFFYGVPPRLRRCGFEVKTS